MDTIAIAFCLQSMFYWFIIYSQKNRFKLPIENVDEYLFWNDHSVTIQNYLNTSSIAVIALCIKNLRILTMYFPSFGVLFDTIRKAKGDLFFFFIMCGVFLVSFMISGNILFGG